MPVSHVGLSRGPRPFPNGFRSGFTGGAEPSNFAVVAGVFAGSSFTSLAAFDASARALQPLGVSVMSTATLDAITQAGLFSGVAASAVPHLDIAVNSSTATAGLVTSAAASIVAMVQGQAVIGGFGRTVAGLSAAAQLYLPTGLSTYAAGSLDTAVQLRLTGGLVGLVRLATGASPSVCGPLSIWLVDYHEGRYGLVLQMADYVRTIQICD